jgi:CDP-glycerol glycerophosphotransferase (TagB/SpsB family)
MKFLLWILYFFSGFFPRKHNIYGTYYKNQYSNSFQFFLNQNNGKFISRIPSFFKSNNSIYIYSIKSLYYHLTANTVYIDYSHQDLLWFLLRGAKVINLWHGMPIKKIEKHIVS